MGVFAADAMDFLLAPAMAADRPSVEGSAVLACYESIVSFHLVAPLVVTVLLVPASLACGDCGFL